MQFAASVTYMFSQYVGQQATIVHLQGAPQYNGLRCRIVGYDTVSADLSSLRGAPIYAIRYAWGVGAGGPGGERICCDDGSPLMGITEPCPAAACPIMASGGLPANPFLARVAAGRCVCIPPQRCDQPPSGAQDAISTLRP